MYGSGGVVYLERLEGPGGLPSGTAGRVIALLSGGIDSPVAAWRMARRGAQVDLLHFHGQPFTDPSSARQSEALARALAVYPPGIDLHLVPLGDAQREVAVACPPDLRMILYRRMMMRIAEELGRELSTEALVSGDALGQVASQTLTNMQVVDEATALPVLRPLLGMTKDEIIATAQSIGTFEISTRKHQDCCVLFEPRSPATKASLEHVQRAESTLNLPELVAKSLSGREPLHL
jgi:thiamine biosynthesis protein ThiI